MEFYWIVSWDLMIFFMGFHEIVHGISKDVNDVNVCFFFLWDF